MRNSILIALSRCPHLIDYVSHEDDKWIIDMSFLLPSCRTTICESNLDKCESSLISYMDSLKSQDSMYGEIIRQSEFPNLSKMIRYIIKSKVKFKRRVVDCPNCGDPNAHPHGRIGGSCEKCSYHWPSLH